jgi:hypothetical protein
VLPDALPELLLQAAIVKAIAAANPPLSKLR